MKYSFSSHHFCTLLIAGCSCFLVGCSSSTNQSAKFQQYYAQGETLYVQHCSNCHQKNGTGLGLLYPPLNTSDYFNDDPGKITCIIRNGASGEMIVNGKKFNHEMPGLPALSELEIAEITTYLYNSWGRQHGIVDVGKVAAALAQCKN
jgi:cytochrome c551